MNLLIKLCIFLSCVVSVSAVDCGIGTPCQNSGTCSSAVGGTCSCNAGFTGDLCEIPINFDFNANTDLTEDQGTYVITVTRVESNYVLTLAITAAGTAADPADYGLSAGSLTLASGVTERDVTLTIVDDTIPETDETIILTMTHTDGTAATKTYTILKNDPVLIHTTFSDNVREGSSDITLAGTSFVFVQGTPAPVPITVTVTSVSGAVLNTDYTVTSGGSITFTYDQSSPAVATAALDAFTITFPEDSVAEVQKSIKVEFTSDYELSGTTSTTILIDDNDGFVITTPSLPTSVVEDGASIDLSSTVFTFVPNTPTPVTLTVKVVAGSAVSPTDFSVSEPSGELTLTYDPTDPTSRAGLDAFTISLPDDSAIEADKTFTVTFESAYDIIGNPNKLITITDNDPEPIALEGPDPVNENIGTATYTLRRTTTIRAVTVTYTIRATAIDTALYNTNVMEESGSVDFAVGEDVKTFDVTLENDNVVQIAKSFTISAEGTLVAAIPDKLVSIVEDDQYEVTFSDVTVTEGSAAIMTFNRDAIAGELIITVTTADFTAEAPSDYTAQSSTSVTFNDGSDTATLNIPITHDLVYEPTETFTITVTSAATLKPSSSSSATITITDNDVEMLTINDVSVAENDGTATLTISREATFEVLTVTAETQIRPGAPFPITASDIVSQSGVTVNFPIGSASATFVVTINDDGVTEADETFIVAIDAPPPIADVTATVTITNDDPYVVTFDEPTLQEGTTGSITFTRIVTDGPLTIVVSTADDTAEAGTDYTAVSAESFTFADGDATVTVPLATSQNNVHEPTETFTFSVTSTQPITVSGPGTVTITDEDAEVLTLTGPPGGAVNEDVGTINIRITRTGTFAPLTISASTLIPSSGTPIQAGDIVMRTSASLTFPMGTAFVDFTVTINNDELYEHNEDFTVEVTGPSPIATKTTTVTITNDDNYEVTFSVDRVTEGDTLTVTFTRDSDVGELRITASTSDISADDVTDYTSLTSAAVVFADGSFSASIDIVTTEDTAYEGTETFTVSISSLVTLKPSSTPSAIVTIIDDDAEVLTLTGPPGGAVNENVGTVSIRVTRTATFAPLTISASTLIPPTGTPIQASDIVMQTSASLTFPMGTAFVDFTVTINNDELLELDEDFTVQVSGPSPIAQKETTVTITNDDLYEVTVSDVTVDEGDSATLTFTRDSSVGSLTLDVTTADDTALSVSDYTAQTTSVTFADTVLTTTVVIPTTEDDMFENDETFTVDISPSGVTLKPSSDLSATVTILNDDSYQVDFIGATVTEGDTQTVTFLRNSFVGELILAVSTAAGTATSVSDYTALTSARVTFSEGSPSATIDIVTTEDNQYEPTENFDMTITSASPLTPSSQTPRTFTINDDDVEVITITGDGPHQENAGSVTLTISRTATFETLDVSASTEIPSGPPNPNFISSNDINMQSNVPLSFAVGSSTVTFTVTITNDELFELDEDFLVAVDAVPNTIDDKEATVTIQNDDLYGVTVNAATVTEGNDLSVEITRDSSIGVLAIAVTTADDTALAASDYTAVTAVPVTFADGSATVTTTISITDDAIYEPTETFRISVTSLETLKPTSTLSAVFTINDNDVETLSITGTTVVQEEDGTVSFMINRQGDFEVLVVSVSTEVPAGEQYPISATGDIAMRTGVPLTFPIGTTSLPFSVTITNDEVAEPDEKFAVSVTAPSPIAAVTFTGTIANNDPDTITFEQNFLGLYENLQSKFVKIIRTVDDKEVTVQVNTQDVTATGGVDYTTLTNQPATFAVGSLETTFAVNVMNDAIDERDETLTLVVSGTTVITTPPKIFIIVDNEGSRPYDCRRRNQNCANETDICTSDLPLCECVGSPAREGDMCNIIIDQKDGPACVSNSINCNNGTCLDDGGVTSCVCDPGFYGKNCQHYYLQAVCTLENMTLIANPHGNFQGSIYVKEMLEVAACNAVAIPSPTPPNDDILLGWTLTVDHDSTDCGPISPQEGAVDISYTRQIIIQYQDVGLGVTTGVDQIVTVSCTVDKNNHLVHAGTVTVDRNIVLVEEAATNQFYPLSLGVDNGRIPVPNFAVVAMNDKLCLTIRIPQAFGGLEMRHIEFNNTLPQDPKEWKVFTAGCPVGDVKAVLVDNPFYPNGNKREIKFCFAVFKFTNSFQLTIACTLKICMDPADCSAFSCGPRKRQAGETSEGSVDATFNIDVPSVQDTVNQNRSSDVTVVSTNEQCSLPMQFIPTVVCLGVLVFLLVLLCLFLIYRLSRRSRKYVEKEEPEPEPVATRIIPQWLVFRR